MTNEAVTLFLCGDVMTGRGIDQVLPRPSDPRLFEPLVRDAREYVHLAEAANGPIGAPVDFDYVWGEALPELRRRSPEVRVVNLETAVTTGDDPWPGKEIHYRMHPGNVPCLQAAGVDCCVLANNHVLDWGHAGLEETLAVLDRAGLGTAGAGFESRARAPAVLRAGATRVLVFAVGSTCSGIPPEWAAKRDTPGVGLLPDLSESAARTLACCVRRARRPDDVVVVSIHWGSNWGYRVPEAQRRFAHLLIDEGDVDVVHGHSSHHPRPIEVYRGRPILYGCGDFLNDYEGIRGYEEFRDDLTLMYFVTTSREEGRLVRLLMAPLQIRNFRLQLPSPADVSWLHRTLHRECAQLGTRVEVGPDGALLLAWD